MDRKHKKTTTTKEDRRNECKYTKINRIRKTNKCYSCNNIK